MKAYILLWSCIGLALDIDVGKIGSSGIAVLFTIKLGQSPIIEQTTTISLKLKKH
jgi:hypothetical protein